MSSDDWDRVLPPPAAPPPARRRAVRLAPMLAAHRSLHASPGQGDGQH